MNKFQKIGIALLRWIVVVFGVVFVFFLISIIPVNKVHPIISDKLVFLQKIEKNIERSIGDFCSAWFLYVNNKNIERTFEQQCAQLKTQYLIQNSFAFENTVLKKRLGFSAQSPHKLLPAEVISRGVDQWFSFVVADKGSSDGVYEGMAVVNHEGVVGYAYEVSKYTTKVILITDPQVSISCINERTQEVTILNGALLHPLEMKYATVHSDIQKGDRLLTSGYSQKFRKYIPIGIVDDVYQPKHKIYKKVFVKPTVQFSKLDIVFFLY